MRIGSGFDVHRLVSDRKLILGGVEIPYEKGLLGHSDADVVTHALMDAILGAACRGDIGKLFPPEDAAFKDADSVALLKVVVAEAAAAGYALSNADITIIAEKPKLAPYIAAIGKTLAAACGVAATDIGVKATTTEGLGFPGRGEGIAAFATVLLKQR